MNIKTALIIGGAILIAAIILRKDESTNIAYQNDAYATNDTYSEEGHPKAQETNYTNNAAPLKNKSTKGNDNIVMQPMMDTKRGIPYSHYPLPSNWKIKNDGWYGPNGTKVTMISSQPMFINQKRYQSPSQLLSGEVGQMIKSAGGKIINQKPLNQIAQKDKSYAQLVAINNQSQYRNEAVGVNLEVKGKKEFLIIKTALTSNHLGGMWYYELVGLEANAGYINEAINYLTHALANYKPNMRQVAMYKADERNKEQASWAAHNGRMSNNQKHFEARQKAIVGANNAVNESMMSSYRSSNESFDRMNQMTTNSIYGENTVTNPYDGTQYQTSDMYDRTFMNAFGEQYQTNDQFYEPGMDFNANGYQEVYPNGGY